MRLHEILKPLKENASAGSTSSGNIASNKGSDYDPNSIGVGFNTKDDWRSIYKKPKKKNKI